MDGIHLAQVRDQWRAVVNTVTKLRVPQKEVKFLTSSVTVRFSIRTMLQGCSYLILVAVSCISVGQYNV
jgi:hypothetical protein